MFPEHFTCEEENCARFTSWDETDSGGDERVLKTTSGGIVDANDIPSSALTRTGSFQRACILACPIRREFVTNAAITEEYYD